MYGQYSIYYIYVIWVKQSSVYLEYLTVALTAFQSVILFLTEFVSGFLIKQLDHE